MLPARPKSSCKLSGAPPSRQLPPRPSSGGDDADLFGSVSFESPLASASSTITKTVRVKKNYSDVHDGVVVGGNISRWRVMEKEEETVYSEPVYHEGEDEDIDMLKRGIRDAAAKTESTLLR